MAPRFATALADLPVALRNLDRSGAQASSRGLPHAPPRDGRAPDRRDGDGEGPHRRGHRHPRHATQGAHGVPLHESRRRHGCAPPRSPGATGDPNALDEPQWRPFQLAFILLNMAGLVDRTHADRETADLLFFPTGGGKTEAYLGLAALVIAHRRLSGSGVLGAGVAVIMRYTLRLLTLDQLARAAGVVCALELMRTEPKNVDERGRRLLGDWPIEIGLWVGSDASPNRLGGKGDADETTAVGRVGAIATDATSARRRRSRLAPGAARRSRRHPSPACRTSIAPTNLEIRCANTGCDFSGNRPLPVLTVDEPIYRRLPAFLIATVDKFAGLPWVGETGAFFGHVDRFEDGVGFYGAAEPGEGRPLRQRLVARSAGPDHPGRAASDRGPLGTVAGLYEAAIDQLAIARRRRERVRPKIVASTATVRRAADQIAALFDRRHDQHFPAAWDRSYRQLLRADGPVDDEPGPALSRASLRKGGAQARLPAALTTLVAAAQAAYDAHAAG